MILGKQKIRLAAWIYTFNSKDSITDFFEFFNARFAVGFDENGKTVISKRQRIYYKFIRLFRKV